MQHFTVQRGAVFVARRERGGGSLKFWLLWDLLPDRSVCLPIRRLDVPRSRWHHRLPTQHSPGGDQRALMVCANEPRDIDTSLLVMADRLCADAVYAIHTTMRRAAESERIEARFRL